MPVQITGIVPHNRSTLGAPLPGSEFDIGAIREFARTQDDAGFDRVLIANAASMPDSMAISQFVTGATSRLGVMVAHRPGFIAPTMAARMLATLDRFSGGRTGVHIIAGASDTELQADGDFSEKETRYRRAGEYVELMRRVWAGGAPFDFDGEFYRVRGATAMVRPESGALKVFWGGESEIAIELAGRHADSYAIFGDTLAGTRPFVEAAHAAAARHGRSLEVMMTLVVIVADTEGQAWDRAAAVLERADRGEVAELHGRQQARDDRAGQAGGERDGTHPAAQRRGRSARRLPVDRHEQGDGRARQQHDAGRDGGAGRR